MQITKVINDLVNSKVTTVCTGMNMCECFNVSTLKQRIKEAQQVIIMLNYIKVLWIKEHISSIVFHTGYDNGRKMFTTLNNKTLHINVGTSGYDVTRHPDINETFGLKDTYNINNVIIKIKTHMYNECSVSKQIDIHTNLTEDYIKRANVRIVELNTIELPDLPETE